MDKAGLRALDRGMLTNRSHWVAVVIMAALAVPTGLVRERAMGHYLETQRYEDVYYLPHADWLPIFSMGFEEALADLVWIRALLYFGEELQHRGSVEHIFLYGDAIVALDPNFSRAYRWVASTALYRPGEVQISEIERALAFLERGVELHPQDGELLWDLGATLSYELAPRIEDRERKNEIKRRGSEFLLRAARLGAGPPWVALSNASQLLRLGQNEQAIRHLEEMYGVVQDDGVRAQIAQRIAVLRSDGHAEALRIAHETFEANRQRDYPYLPATFYLILGPRTSSIEPASLQ